MSDKLKKIHNVTITVMVRLLHEHWRRRHKAHVPSWNWDQKLRKRCYSHHDVAAASITEGTTFVFVQVYCFSNEASALEGRSIFRLLALSKIVRMWFDDFRFRLLCAEQSKTSTLFPGKSCGICGNFWKLNRGKASDVQILSMVYHRVHVGSNLRLTYLLSGRVLL